MMRNLLCSLVATALIVGEGEAFSSPLHSVSSSTTTTSTRLNGQKNAWVGPASAVTAALGWGLASQIAVASMSPLSMEDQPAWTSSSSLVAVEKLDFSLPSYNSFGKESGGGFGEGAELRMSTDSLINPGANEKGKQLDAMRRAEEARLARKEEAKKLRAQEAEASRRQAELKKIEDKRRIKELFSGN